jgi:hypothetical protein
VGDIGKHIVHLGSVPHSDAAVVQPPAVNKQRSKGYDEQRSDDNVPNHRFIID